MSRLSPHGGRRFLLSLGTLLMTGVLTWFGKIDAGAYSTVVLAVVGAYIAGNTYQKTRTSRGESNDV